MAIKIDTLRNVNNSVVTKQWIGLSLADNEGEPLKMVDLSDATVQIDGDFDDKTKVVIMGSNDGQGFYPVSDPQGAAWKIRKPGIYSIGQNVAHIKPFLEDGGEATNIKVTLHARSQA